MIVALMAIGLGIGIRGEAGQASANASACSDYWAMKSASGAGPERAAFQKLLAAERGITNPALRTAVEAFTEDISNNDATDAGAAAIATGTACTALGYNNPG